MSGTSDQILAYAQPTPKQRGLPAPSWINRVAIAATLILLPIIWAATGTAYGSADYDDDSITLMEATQSAIQSTWDRSWVSAAIGIPIVGVVAVIVFTRVKWIREKTWIALGISILPVLLCGPLAALGPLFALLLPHALLGLDDGETWSEGFVMISAVGCWTLLWLGIAILLAISRRWQTADR